MTAGTRRWSIAIAAVVAAAAGARTGHAGRTHFGWLRAAEVVPQRGVEIETWLVERNGIADGPDRAPDETLVWWWTVVGITDQLELGLPVQIRHQKQGDDGTTELVGYGAELRYRLVSPDRVEAGPIAPALRLGVQRLVGQRRRVRTDAGAVLGIDLGDRVHAAIDLGATWFAGDGRATVELTPAAGLSVRVAEELRLGGEAYAELSVRGPGPAWVAVGPSLSWTHGRFWLSASLPFGVLHADTAPRLNWAVAF